jgi:hypothetical protein
LAAAVLLGLTFVDLIDVFLAIAFARQGLAPIDYASPVILSPKA